LDHKSKQFLIYGSLVITIFTLGIANIPMASATEYSVSIPSGTAMPGCEGPPNWCYSPEILKINVGDTVIWYNDDTAAHTVTSGAPWGGPEGEFDSSLFMSGTTYSHTFDAPGSYPYFCMVHPWMFGEIIVGGTSTPDKTPRDTTISMTDFCSRLHDEFEQISSSSALDVEDMCVFFSGEYGDRIEKQTADEIIENIWIELDVNPTIPENNIFVEDFCTELQMLFDEQIGVSAVDFLCDTYYQQYVDVIDRDIANDIIDEIQADIDGGVYDIPEPSEFVPPEFNEYTGLNIPKFSTPVVYDIYVNVDRIIEVDRINRQFDAVLQVEIFAHIVPDTMYIDFRHDPPLFVDTGISEEIKSAMTMNDNSQEFSKTPKIEFVNKVGDLVRRYSLNAPNDDIGVVVETDFDGVNVIKVFWRKDKTYTYFSLYVAQERLIKIQDE